jgi:glycosyltransferase involved in cell wall biosynthesis
VRIVLFDWVCGGHHELYLRRFAEALQAHAEVVVAAPDAAYEQLEGVPVLQVPLGSPRPPISAKDWFDPRRRSVLEEEIRLLEQAERASSADLSLHLYADAALSHLVMRRPRTVPLSIVLFRPRAYYSGAFDARLGPATFLRTHASEFLVARWRARKDARAVLTLDEMAAQRWNARRGAPAHWIPEPPVAPLTQLAVPERRGCVVYGAIGARKGIDLIARAVSVEATPIEITIAGETIEGFEPQLRAHVAEIRRGGATVDVRAKRHDEVAGLQVLAGARCALLAYERHSGMSRVLLEACCVGTPVIVHDRGLLGYLVKRYRLGRAIDCRNPHEFRTAILELTRDGAREEFAASLGEFARRYTADKFEWAVASSLGVLDSAALEHGPDLAGSAV